MTLAGMTHYRIRVAWLDRTNEAHWSEWFDGYSRRGEYMGSGVPPCVERAIESGFMLDAQCKNAVGLGVVSVPLPDGGMYIPAHRITAVDWKVEHE